MMVDTQHRNPTQSQTAYDSQAIPDFQSTCK